jgi:electron transfer flavoprotein alpha/beta subunit
LLTGAATLDTGQSQLGSRLATALAWPQIVYAWQVTCRRATVQAVLQEGHGYVAVETDLPAVITLHPDALRLRYPNGARLINVYRDADAVEQWDMGEDAFKPLLEGHRQEFPPERERGMRVSGTPDEMAQVLADVFKAHALCQVGSEGDYG